MTKTIDTASSMLTVCGGSEHIQAVDELIEFDSVVDLGERLLPGERVPEGECRSCGSLAHRIELKSMDLLLPHVALTREFSGEAGPDLKCEGCGLGKDGHRVMADSVGVGIVCLSNLIGEHQGWVGE